MAPKKSSKGKGAAVEPAHEKGWNTSKCPESDLETLVLAGLLVPKSIIVAAPPKLNRLKCTNHHLNT